MAQHFGTKYSLVGLEIIARFPDGAVKIATSLTGMLPDRPSTAARHLLIRRKAAASSHHCGRANRRRGLRTAS